MGLKESIKKIPALFYLFPLVILAVEVVFVIILQFFNLGKSEQFNPAILKGAAILLLIGGLFCYYKFFRSWKRELITLEELKSMAVRAGLFILAFILFGFLTFLAKTNARLGFFIISVLFFLLGIGHLFEAVKRDNEMLRFWPFLGAIWCIGGLGFISLAFIIASGLSIQTEIPTIFYFAFLAFLVPPFAYMSYILWGKIPSAYPELWYFDPYKPAPPIPPLTTYSCIFSIDGRDHIIRIPVLYKVGDAMWKFLAQSERDGLGIKYYQEDSKGNKHYWGWYFSTQIEGSNSKRFIDWSLSFLQNKINKGAKIWVERAK